MPDPTGPMTQARGQRCPVGVSPEVMLSGVRCRFRAASVVGLLPGIPWLFVESSVLSARNPLSAPILASGVAQFSAFRVVLAESNSLKSARCMATGSRVGVVGGDVDEGVDDINASRSLSAVPPGQLLRRLRAPNGSPAAGATTCRTRSRASFSSEARSMRSCCSWRRPHRDASQRRDQTLY